MSNLIDFTKRFGESLSQKVKLSNYSWFNLGGNAEFFFKPKDKTELLEFFKEAKKNEDLKNEDVSVKIEESNDDNSFVSSKLVYAEA